MRYISAVFALLGASVCSAAVHVSLQGSADGDGSAQRPLLSIADAVVRARQDPQHRVLIHPGEYFDTHVELVAADSGLTIEAAEASRPILYGGIPLTGWAADADGSWSAPLPKARAWDVRMLLADGELAPRARFPAEGKLTHQSVFDVPWMSTTGGGWKRKPTDIELTTMKFNPADLPRDIDWPNAEVTVYHVWDESVSGVAKCDYNTSTITFSNKLGHPAGGFGVKTYVIWNIRRGLGTPGQWMFDRVNNRILYRPKPGQDMSKMRVLVPTQNTILSVSGTDKDPIRNVVLRNLELSLTTVPGITGGFGAYNFPGALQCASADTLIFDRLSIHHVAGQAISSRWTNDLRNIAVTRCEIAWCGAGGICLQGQGMRYEDNHIHHIGRIFPSGIGIGRTGEKYTIRHNLLHDCSYSAIGLGGNDMLIENNEFYRCMTELHDGAAVYIGGGKRDVVRGNYVHDITDPNESRPWNTPTRAAYYLDEQCEDCIVESNLAVNVEMPSQNHMARKNTIRGNIFITAGDQALSFARCADYSMSGNLIQAGGTVTIRGTNNIATWQDNIIHAGKVVSVTLEDYQQKQSSDTAPSGTVASDPQITVSAKGLCTLASSSPAVSLKLPKLDFSQTGPRP